jgi:hypothetical protein
MNDATVPCSHQKLIIQTQATDILTKYASGRLPFMLADVNCGETQNNIINLHARANTSGDAQNMICVNLTSES